MDSSFLLSLTFTKRMNDLPAKWINFKLKSSITAKSLNFSQKICEPFSLSKHESLPHD